MSKTSVAAQQEAEEMVSGIESLVVNVIKEKLRLKVVESPHDGVEIQLMLGEERIGEPYYLELNHDGEDWSELYIGVE